MYRNGIGNVNPCCLNHPGHSNYNQLFTPWHRLFIYQMEKALGLAMPFWDWTNPNPNPNPQTAWQNGPIKTSDTTSGGLTYRDYGWMDYQSLRARVSTAFMTGQVVTDIMTFNNQIREPHDTIHARVVRGSMGTIQYAAYDPIFYLHHSNVEKQYAFWQALRQLKNLPIDGFTTDVGNHPMQPFATRDSSTFYNPYDKTFDNPTALNGIDYKCKFGYEYENLTFKGLTPQQYLDQYETENAKFGIFAGFTVKKPGVTSVTTFNYSDPSEITRNQEITESFSNMIMGSSKDNNELNVPLIDVQYLASPSFDPLDKTHHFEITSHVAPDNSPLPLADTYKPVVVYREPSTDHRDRFVYRIHTEYIDQYSPSLIHCQLDTKVEFLERDGSYSNDVSIEGQNVNGPFEILKRTNNFSITSRTKTTYINIGFNSKCHIQVINVYFYQLILFLQCNAEGLPYSGEPGILVVPWQTEYLNIHDNSVMVKGEV